MIPELYGGARKGTRLNIVRPIQLHPGRRTVSPVSRARGGLGVGGIAEVYEATHTLPGGMQADGGERKLSLLSHDAALPCACWPRPRVLGTASPSRNIVPGVRLGESERDAVSGTLEYIEEGPSVSECAAPVFAPPAKRMHPSAPAFAANVPGAGYVRGSKRRRRRRSTSSTVT